MNFLVINGHKNYWYSKGELNKTLFEKIVNTLSKKHEVKTTIIEQGYIVDDEIDKYKWADVVIYQTPVNWYYLPWIFKKYIDEVYQMGSFYQSGQKYGSGGLMKNKKYMLSLTCAAPKAAFEGIFFNKKNVDEIFTPFHLTHKFCNMKPLKTFCVYDVVKNPNVEKYLFSLDRHLKKLFFINI